MADKGSWNERSTDPSQLKCAGLRALILSLVSDGSCEDDGTEQVLMDIDLDGRRYLVIRMPAIERKSAVLSPREIEIVRLVAQGHPNKVIAAVLDISSWTVCTHMRRVFAKLGVTSRAAMIARLAECRGALDGIPPSRQPCAQAAREEADFNGLRAGQHRHGNIVTEDAPGVERIGADQRRQRRRVAVHAPTQSASVETLRSMPSRAKPSLWRFSG
jgi:DNA-binding CsgD family transcriptional regulator